LVAGLKFLPLIDAYRGALSHIGPLAAAAFATVFEVAVFLGTPLGVAIAGGKAIHHNSAGSADGFIRLRALLSSVFVTGLLWALLTSLIGGISNVELATPGRVANGLLETAKEACTTNRGKTAVTIPILGSHWRCNDSGPPTLVGEFARSSAKVSYSASGMTVSSDMTYVELAELKVSSPAVKGRPEVHLNVEGAKLRGFWSLARPVKLGEWGRAIFVSMTALYLSLLVIWVVGVRRLSRFRALAVGGLVPLTAWLTLLYLDGRDGVGISRYLVVPAVGTVMALTLWIAFSYEPKRVKRPVVYRKQLDSTPS
jgi:hypothetical protein